MMRTVIDVCTAAYRAVEAFLGGAAVLIVLVLLGYWAVLCWQTLDERADERRTLRAVRECGCANSTIHDMWISLRRMKFCRDMWAGIAVIGWGLALAQGVAFVARVIQ